MTCNLRNSMRTLCAASALGLVLAACSTGGSGLTTGSFVPSFNKKAPADPATERAMMVATTSARAVKCGYNFDPARLRTSYLAHESTQGTSPDAIAKLEKTYDFTRDAIIKRIAQEEDYCDDGRTAEIKRDLTRYLAGDYSMSERQSVAQKNFWEGANKPAPINRERLFNPESPR